MSSVRRIHRASLLLSAALLLSCNESPTRNNETRTPASLDIVSGDEHNGVVGTELANPLVVRVVNATGVPIIAQLVNFRVTSGDGSIFAGSSPTNVFFVRRIAGSVMCSWMSSRRRAGTCTSWAPSR